MGAASAKSDTLAKAPAPAEQAKGPTCVPEREFYTNFLTNGPARATLTELLNDLENGELKWSQERLAFSRIRSILFCMMHTRPLAALPENDPRIVLLTAAGTYHTARAICASRMNDDGLVAALSGALFSVSHVPRELVAAAAAAAAENKERLPAPEVPTQTSPAPPLSPPAASASESLEGAAEPAPVAAVITAGNAHGKDV